MSGRRVLQLGCSDVSPAIALARQGAHVIAIVDDPQQRDRARRVVEDADAKVELHQGDLADLAFIRADTVDAAFSDGALRAVDDLDRVFRQVHRVLRTDGPLVVALRHPAGDIPEDGSYFDRGGGRRTIGDLFASFTRAHFSVDTLLEPEGGSRPGRLVLRGRKLGN